MYVGLTADIILDTYTAFTSKNVIYTCSKSFEQADERKVGFQGTSAVTFVASSKMAGWE